MVCIVGVSCIILTVNNMSDFTHKDIKTHVHTEQYNLSVFYVET